MDDSASDGGTITIDAETFTLLIRALGMAVALATHGGGTELWPEPKTKQRKPRTKPAHLNAVEP